RAVSAQELLAAVWPGESVTSGSVGRAILGARRALGDDGDAQGSIRTARGHGYQFALPVSVCIHPDVQSSTANEQLATPLSAWEPELEFVGRHALLADLDARLKHAFSRNGHLVLLTGEPGIGKSRTAQQVLLRARKLGADCWLGRCLEEDGAPAYWPWIEILRQAHEARGTAQLAVDMGLGLADIAQAIPELKQWFPSIPDAPPLGTAAARFRFFDSFTRFIVNASATRPLLLCFDDLQRADPPTLRLLTFMVGQLSDAPVMVLGTMRSSAIRPADECHALSRISREHPHRTFELSGLTSEEISGYLDTLYGGSLPPSAAAHIYEQTDGNPLFFFHMLASKRNGTGGSPVAWDGSWQLPSGEGLHAMLARSLATLPDISLRSLRAASVLGREFALGVLSNVLECEHAPILGSLEPAIAARVLRRVDGQLARYRFTHALLRDALYESVEPLERARLHARAGFVLETCGAGLHEDHLSELAFHFCHAAPTHDQGRAQDYSRRAAHAATQQLAHEKTAQHLENVLRLLTPSELSQARRLEVLLELGEAYNRAGDVAAAQRALHAAVDLARVLGSTDAFVLAAQQLAAPLQTGTVDVLLVALLREGLALLPAGDARAAKLRALLARSLSYAGDLTERTSLALEARRSAELLPARPRADLLMRCHEALSEPNHLASRCSITDELARLARELGDQNVLMRSCACQIQNYLALGDLDSIDAALEVLTEAVERMRDPIYRWWSCVYRAMRSMVAGDLTAGERHAREAFQMKLFGQEGEHAFATQVDGMWRLQGKLKESEELASKMASRYPHMVGWRASLALVHVATQRKQRAARTFASLMDADLAIVRSNPFLLSTLAPMAELCAQVGDPASAKLLYDALAPFADQHPTIHYGVASYGPAHRHLGMLAARMEQLDLAVSHYESSLRSARAMPSPTFICVTEVAYARTLVAFGCQGLHTEKVLSSAHQLAIHHGFHGIVALCRSLSERHGLTLRAMARTRPNDPLEARRLL
ncbi:MAG: transcriptional regulator, partial [Myxococcaceae bacterium]|nr:transcriptional regulator [Myxococcaceae bacterium]